MDEMQRIWFHFLWGYITEMLKTPRHITGGDEVWSDGSEILCGEEHTADIIADFLEGIGFEEVHTGYYDPEEDKRNGETDDHTGYYYIDID